MTHSAALYSYGEYDLDLNHVDKNTIKTYSIGEIDSFIADTAGIKIVAIEISYDYPKLTDIELEKLKNCDLVVVKSIELTADIIKLIMKYDNSNFVFVVNGLIRSWLANAKVECEASWVTTTAEVYQNSLEDLANKNLFPFKEKPWMFDVLYGLSREHRIFVKDKLQEYKDNKWFYESPFFTKDSTHTWDNLNFDNTDLWDDDIEIDQDNAYKCKYHGHNLMISQIVPFKIYNKTAYSLVLETAASNSFSFFTEKIAKPMLAYRLFIVVSGQYYLKNLRKLGFKTFDGIIDESYDLEPDNQRRWGMAVEQAALLCQRSQQEILLQIAPIVFHNYQVLKNLNSNKVNDHIETYLIQQGLHRTHE
jgi:hypothetical protein